MEPQYLTVKLIILGPTIRYYGRSTNFHELLLSSMKLLAIPSFVGLGPSTQLGYGQTPESQTSGLLLRNQ
jgi:hypothetical protein